jgi:hypothetical protein
MPIYNSTQLRPKPAFLIKLLITLMVIFLFCSNGVHAAQVHLEWSPSPSYLVEGYRVHWGTSSKNYTQNIDTGLVTHTYIYDLDEDTRYYFAVTAYSDDLESDFSNEVSAISGVPITEHITGTGGCVLNTNAHFSVEWLVFALLGFLSLRKKFLRRH